MTILVPFDGSKLSEAALVRATTLSDTFDETVLAVTVIPEGNAEYARKHGWLGPDEEYDEETVVARLHEQVTDVAPAADFRHELVSRYASTGTIAQKLRATAKDADVRLVVIGSDNAGSMVASIHSVGSTVAADSAFDVLIVRRSVHADGASGW